MTVLCYSGGLDSTVLLYDLIRRGHEAAPLFFDYGQDHGAAEQAAARTITARLGLTLPVVDLPAECFAGSALTGGEGLVVPNRNMVFLAVAAAYAVARGHVAVAIAATVDDRETWPDCRAEFMEAMTAVLEMAHGVRVLHPYTAYTKAEVARLGAGLGVPIPETWSCYRAGPSPCGSCAACSARESALR